MGALSDAQVAQFEEQGYLALEDVLDPRQDLDPVIEEYSLILDRLARELYERDEISALHAGLPFARRLTQIQYESGKSFTQHFDIALPKRNVAEDTPFSVGPAVFDLLCNARLLDAVESLIGGEIFANPIQHVRLRQPAHLSANPRPLLSWHQDNAFMMPEADATEVVTLRIPLLDATVANGCLQVIPYSHRDGLQQHCSPGVNIPDRLIRGDEAVPVPLQQGGVLFMHRLMEHAPLPNHTDTIRWSFDLRYNPSGKPTGRDVQPGFLARSRSHPETEVRDYEIWSALWYRTRRKLAGQPDPVYERWGADEPGCA